ncbi:MAG TPA: glycosyltransferase [Bryobacteraceae bacterium]|nr:glycosyltransferase [Bryobacteraceae bacterium]
MPAPRAPRIAFFTDSFHEVNGVALTSREFAGFAQRRGYPFFSVHAGPETRHWREGTFETFELKNSRAILGLEHDLAFDLLFLRHYEAVRKRLAEFRPDVVHVTGPSHAGLLGAILAHRMRIPVAASWHTNLHEFAARRLDRKLGWLPTEPRRHIAKGTETATLDITLQFYRLAKLLFAPNPELVDMLQTRLRRPTYLMQRGIDTSLFSPARRTRDNENFTIGFVGRLSPEKNVRLLSELERAIHAAGAENCRFLIVGDGSEREWLIQHMKAAAIPGILRGQALAEAYANMDVFVFPSLTDTFGNVVLESMASGVPAIVTSSGGPRYLVQSGVNGYITDTVKEIVRAVLHLRISRSLRARMAKDARETALAYSWDNVFGRVYQRYEELQPAGKLSSVPLYRQPGLSVTP